LPLNIVSSESFTRHELPTLLSTHFVGDSMEKALSEVQRVQTSIGSGSPRAFDGDIQVCSIDVFHTDGSLIDGWSRFAIHQIEIMWIPSQTEYRVGRQTGRYQVRLVILLRNLLLFTVWVQLRFCCPY
jgi:hypothetical protein